MSVLVRAMTSDDDAEIKESIELVRNSSLLGLIHESVDVNHIGKYTRSWFAWANSVFAQTIIHLAENKPHLLFGPDASPYKIERGKWSRHSSLKIALWQVFVKLIIPIPYTETHVERLRLILIEPSFPGK